MKLKTSYFNTVVLKKDMTRFAPVWGLYTVFMLMTLFLILANSNAPASFAVGAPDIMMAMGMVNFVYGGLCALLLFGDLFQSRMAGALHAMPLRREGWFFTHLTAGLLFCLVPNCLGATIASTFLQEYCYLAFIWLAIMIIQFVFFFGVGAFSIQCAGNRLGALAVYGLFNFLSVLAAFLVNAFYAPILHGIKPDLAALCRYSPVVGFSAARYVSVNYSSFSAKAIFEGFIAADWRFLFITLAVGLLLLVVSILLYRKRQIESAGDFIAVKPVAPVFLVIYTLCFGAVLYFIVDLIGSGAEYVFLLLGFAIGFFTGWMLLEKKVNIFSAKRLLGFGLLTLSFFMTIAITWLDPLGITRYVPNPDHVESVAISPYASDYYLDNRAQVLTEPEDIEAVINVHSDLIALRNTDKNNSAYLRLRYTLRSGITVDRQYYLDANARNSLVLKKYFSDFQFITHQESVEDLLKNTYSIKFDRYTDSFRDFTISTEKREDTDDKFNEEQTLYFSADDTLDKYAVSIGLIEAIYADCEAGTMTQLWDFHSGEVIGHLRIHYSANYYEYEELDITIFSDCENTVAYLKMLTAK